MSLQKNPLFRIADWIAQTPANWQSETIHLVKRAYIDLAACMILGRNECVTLKARTLATAWGAGGCPIVGHPQKLSAPMAAFVNGTMAHALDFDDDFDPAKCHPTATIVPALLALIPSVNPTGRDLIDAYVIGLEVTGRVGQALNPYHRRRGWHATATLGTIGATAACARLLKLDVTQIKNALSASTSMAAGFASQFGSMIKPMHAGFAAMRGVMAANMAQIDVTAGDHSFDGPFGLRRLFIGPDCDDIAETMKTIDEYGQKSTFNLEKLGQPLIIHEYGLKVKRFPNCGSVHRALDNLLHLVDEHALVVNDIAAIHVTAPLHHMRNLPYDKPRTAMEAKFSLPFGLAAGLLYKTITFNHFDDTVLQNPEIITLYDKITYTGVDKMESECPTITTITLKNGQQLDRQTYHPVGSRTDPLTDDQLWQKFADCTQGFNKSIVIKTMLADLENQSECHTLLSAFTG